MKVASALSICALALAAPVADFAARADTTEPSVVGFWQETDDSGKPGAWFYFQKMKGNTYEGRFVKMFKQKASDPDITTCSKCEGDQKDAAMIGLTLVKGMKRDGRKYSEGWILDPRDGTEYHALMEVSDDGQKLSVRGYLGIPMLGQTQTWTRLPDDTIAPCEIPDPSVGPGAPKPKSMHPKDCASATPASATADAKDSGGSDAPKEAGTPTPKKHAKDHTKPSPSAAKDSPTPSATE